MMSSLFRLYQKPPFFITFSSRTLSIKTDSNWNKNYFLKKTIHYQHFITKSHITSVQKFNKLCTERDKFFFFGSQKAIKKKYNIKNPRDFDVVKMKQNDNISIIDNKVKNKKYSLDLNQYKQSLILRLFYLQDFVSSKNKINNFSNKHAFFQLASANKSIYSKKFLFIKSYLKLNNFEILALQVRHKKKQKISSNTLFQEPFLENNKNYNLSLSQSEKKTNVPWIFSLNKKNKSFNKKNFEQKKRNDNFHKTTYKQNLFNYWILPFFAFVASMTNIFFYKSIPNRSVIKNFIVPVNFEKTTVSFSQVVKKQQSNITNSSSFFHLSENLIVPYNQEKLQQGFIKRSSAKKILNEDIFLYNLYNKSFLKTQRQNWNFFEMKSDLFELNYTDLKFQQQNSNDSNLLLNQLAFFFNKQKSQKIKSARFFIDSAFFKNQPKEKLQNSMLLKSKSKTHNNKFLLFPKKIVLLSSKENLEIQTNFLFLQKPVNILNGLDLQLNNKDLKQVFSLRALRAEKKTNQTASSAYAAGWQARPFNALNLSFLLEEKEVKTKLDLLVYKTLYTQLLNKKKTIKSFQKLYKSNFFVDSSLKHINKFSENLNNQNKIKDFKQRVSFNSEKDFQKINSKIYSSALKLSKKKDSSFFILKYFPFLFQTDNSILQNKNLNFEIYKQKYPILELSFLKNFIALRTQPLFLSLRLPDGKRNTGKRETKKLNTDLSHKINKKPTLKLHLPVLAPLAKGTTTNVSNQKILSGPLWSFSWNKNQIVQPSSYLHSFCLESNKEVKKFNTKHFFNKKIKQKNIINSIFFQNNIRLKNYFENSKVPNATRVKLNNKKMFEKKNIKKRKQKIKLIKNKAKKTFRVSRSAYAAYAAYAAERQAPLAELALQNKKFTSNFQKNQNFRINLLSNFLKNKNLTLFSFFRQTKSYSNNINLFFYRFNSPYLTSKNKIKYFQNDFLIFSKKKIKKTFTNTLQGNLLNSVIEKQVILNKTENRLDLLKKFNQKTFFLSPSRVLENRRFFVKINTVNKFLPRFVWEPFVSVYTTSKKKSYLFLSRSTKKQLTKSQTSFPVLTKKTYIRRQFLKRKQLKRRIKCQRHKNRKKRKRSRHHPRPLWLRYNFYQRFLKKRYLVTKSVRFLDGKHSLSQKRVENQNFYVFARRDKVNSLKSSKWHKAFKIITYYKNIPKNSFYFYMKLKPSFQKNINFSDKYQLNKKIKTKSLTRFVRNSFNQENDTVSLEKGLNSVPYGKALKKNNKKRLKRVSDESRQRLRLNFYRIRLKKQNILSNEFLDISCEQTIPRYFLPIAFPSLSLLSFENLSDKFIQKFLFWYYIPDSYPFPFSVFPRSETNRTILKTSWSLNKRNFSFASLRSNTKKSAFLRRASLRQIRLTSAWMSSLQKHRSRYNRTEKIKKQLQKTFSNFIFSNFSNPVLTYINTTSENDFLNNNKNFLTGQVSLNSPLSGTSLIPQIKQNPQPFLLKFAKNPSNVSLKTFKNNEQKLTNLLRSPLNFSINVVNSNIFHPVFFSLRGKNIKDLQSFENQVNVLISDFPKQITTLQQFNNPFSFWWTMSTRRVTNFIPFKMTKIFQQFETNNLLFKTKSLTRFVRNSFKITDFTKFGDFSNFILTEVSFFEKPKSSANVIFNNFKTELYSNFIFFFLISSLLFHVCCFFSLITISQIRCVIKFVFLIFYKITGMFSIEFFYQKLSGISNSFYFIKNILYPSPNCSNFLMTKITYIGGEKSFYQSTLFSFFKTKSLTRFVRNSFKTKKFFLEMCSNNQKFLDSHLSYFLRSATQDNKNLFRNPVKFKRVSDESRQRLRLNFSNSKENNNFFSIQKNFPMILVSNSFRYSFLYHLNRISQIVFVSSQVSYKKTKTIYFLSFLYLNSFVDFVESCLNLIFQFFKNPNEISVDLFALLFLVEWYSDLTSITPDSLQSDLSNTFFKNLRAISILGPLSFFLKKPFFHFFEILFDTINQPDTDLLYQQKKGILFFDQWLDYIIRLGSLKNIKNTELKTIKIAIESHFDKKILEDLQWIFKKETLQDLSLPNVGGAVSGTQKTKNKVDKSSYLLQIPKDSIDYSACLCFFCRTASGASRPAFAALQCCIAEETKAAYAAKALFSSFNIKTSTNVFENKTEFINNFFFSTVDNLTQQTFTQNKFTNKKDRWAVNQFITMQSLLQPELFVFYGIPKSLIKEKTRFKGFIDIVNKKMDSFTAATVGSFILKIYSGIFYKDVAKNVLVIGDKNTNKTLIIQAIAGETELSFITENANSYKLVINGVSVGLSLLKEVFEALPVHSPCIFLLEDIHVIGQRRAAFLVQDFSSDDDVFMNDNYAVHEKNQIYYTLSRHKFLSYRKSFASTSQKGSRTNKIKKSRQQEIHHPLYLDSSQNKNFNGFKNIFNKNKYVNKFKQNSYLSNYYTNEKKSLLNVDSSIYESNRLNYFLRSATQDIQKMKINEAFFSQNWSVSKDKNSVKKSSLEIQKPLVVVPPSTSPLNILILKEQKKMKPQKLVKEISWAGIPSEQLSRLAPFSYSIKIKILMLVDAALENVYAKVNMITELLIMLDTVRSNKGFVVFATTHLPSILDPALRRPGRFDDTIYLPVQISKKINRWQNFQFIITDDDFAYNFYNFNVSVQYLSNELTFLTKNCELFLRNSSVFHLDKHLFFHSSIFSLTETNKIMNKSIQTFSKEIHKINALLAERASASETSKAERNSGPVDSLQNTFNFQKNFDILKNTLTKLNIKNYNQINSIDNNLLTVSQNQFSYLIKQLKRVSDESRQRLRLKQSNGKQKFYKEKLYNNFNKKFEKFWNHIGYSFLDVKSYQNFSSIISLVAYLYIIDLFSFTEKSYKKILFKKFLLNKIKLAFDIVSVSTLSMETQKNNNQHDFLFNLLNLPSSQTIKNKKNPSYLFNTLQPTTRSLNFFENLNEFLTNLVRDFVLKNFESVDFSNTKRVNFLFNQIIKLTDGISFSNKNMLQEPPSAPFSSVTLPSRRFENYKRVEKDYQIKGNFSIQYKIQMHQNKKRAQQLYVQDINEQLNKNQSKQYNLENRKLNRLLFTKINNRIKTDSTSMNWFVQKKIIKRHSLHLTNLWWNGQLPEHNKEQTFLSDIDWRIMSRLKNKKQKLDSSVAELTEWQKTAKQSINLDSINNSLEEFSYDFKNNNLLNYIIDFPDSEQYYNPKERRWMLSSGYFSYWFDIEMNSNKLIINKEKWLQKLESKKNSSKKFKTHINQIDLPENFINYIEYYTFFDKHRELLDFFAFKLLEKGLLKEIDFIRHKIKYNYKK